MKSPRLSILTDPKDLAELLGVTYPFLRRLFYRSLASEQYSTFEIKKSSGAPREISAPSRPIKTVQRNLLPLLEELYTPRPSAHGFVKQRSIVTNAKCHARKAFVFNIDLKDFFSSINFGRIRGMLIAPPYSLDASTAAVIAHICCRDSILPQGAPTSPIVANMICSRLDRELQELAKSNHCVYTRYADDITFSFRCRVTALPQSIVKTILIDGEVDKSQVDVGDALYEIVTRNGFQVNQRKVRIQHRFERQVVTGLTVNKFPNVDRKYIRNLRAILFDWELNGLTKAKDKYLEQMNGRGIESPSAFEAYVQGRLLFLKMVRGGEDELYLHLATRFNLVSENLKVPGRRSSLRISSNSDHQNERKRRYERRLVNFSTWIIEANYDDEESGICVAVQATAFMLENIGLVTCFHVIEDLDISKIEVFSAADRTKRYSVDLLGSEKHHDLAILKVTGVPEETNFTCFTLGDCTNLKDGDPVNVYGFPNMKSSSSVTALYARITSSYMQSGQRRFEIDHQIRAGNSGGPVTNGNGQVVGVVSKGATREEGENAFLAAQSVLALAERISAEMLDSDL